MDFIDVCAEHVGGSGLVQYAMSVSEHPIPRRRKKIIRSFTVWFWV